MCLAISIAIFAISLLLLTAPIPGVNPLYATCVLGGLSYGAYNCLFPVTLAELVGVEALPVLFPLLFGPAFGLGSLLLSTLNYGARYDAAMNRHGLNPSIDACPYDDCYKPALRIGAACCFISSALFVLVAYLHGHGVAAHKMPVHEPAKALL